MSMTSRATRMIGTIRRAVWLAGYCAIGAGAAHAQECAPSRFGADDEIGAANLVTAESVLAAMSLVQAGQVHPLGIVIDPGMPAFAPRQMMLQVVQPGQHHGRSLDGDFGWPMTYNDDLSQLWWGMGPQIDGLGHLGEAGVFYNCTPGGDFSAITGLEKFGIEKIPPLVARGVLIDMARHFGVAALEGGQAFGVEDIEAAAGGAGRGDTRRRRRVVPHGLDRRPPHGGPGHPGRHGARHHE